MPKRVEWFHSRPGCVACARAQSFFERHGIEVAEVNLAHRNPLPRMEAFRIAKRASELYVVQGKLALYMSLKKRLRFDAGELARRILNKGGFLRSPATLVGETLLIGFDEDLFCEAFKVPPMDVRKASGA